MGQRSAATIATARTLRLRRRGKGGGGGGGGGGTAAILSRSKHCPPRCRGAAGRQVTCEAAPQALRQSDRFYHGTVKSACSSGRKCRHVFLYNSRPTSIQKVANFSYRPPAPALSGPGIKIGGQNLKVSYVIPDSSEHMSTHTAPVNDPLGLVFVLSLIHI